MEITVLGSGSAGNCYKISDGASSLLLDAGLRYKQIQTALDFRLSALDGVLLTHSHKDHSKSILAMMQAGVDCYMAQDTAFEIGATGHRAQVIEPHKQIAVGGWGVLPFDLRHDVTNYGYLIQSRATGERLLYATDTCYIPYTFNNLNYIMIEVNHCRETLDENTQSGAVNLSLRNRIVENHMGLETAIGFFKANDLSQVNQIILLHLSESNAQAEQILKSVRQCTGRMVTIA